MKQIIRRVKAQAKTTAIGSALTLLGLPAVRRKLRPRLEHAGLILMFHHVTPSRPDRLGLNRGLEVTPETLERVIVSLKSQDYDIVPIDAVPERLAHGDERRFAALTFDDGGRDNLVYAAPILQRHEAPFTVYVTTGFASGTATPWWHVLERVVLENSALTIDTDQGVQRFDTSNPLKKQRAAGTIHDMLWRADEQSRSRLVTELAAQAGVDISSLTREVFMGWEELRQIAALPGCAIGAHTMTHANLAQLDERSAMREIGEARDVLRQRLGVEVNHFAYPYGAPGCCELREFELVRKAGFTTAVTTRRGLLAPGDLSGLTSLPRVPINGYYQHPLMIDALVSGAPMSLARSAGLPAAAGRNGWMPHIADDVKRPEGQKLEQKFIHITSQSTS